MDHLQQAFLESRKKMKIFTIINYYSSYYYYTKAYLDWLERRLQGIPMQTAIDRLVETYNLAA